MKIEIKKELLEKIKNNLIWTDWEEGIEKSNIETEKQITKLVNEIVRRGLDFFDLGFGQLSDKFEKITDSMKKRRIEEKK